MTAQPQYKIRGDNQDGWIPNSGNPGDCLSPPLASFASFSNLPILCSPYQQNFSKEFYLALSTSQPSFLLLLKSDFCPNRPTEITSEGHKTTFNLPNPMVNSQTSSWSTSQGHSTQLYPQNISSLCFNDVSLLVFLLISWVLLFCFINGKVARGLNLGPLFCYGYTLSLDNRLWF